MATYFLILTQHGSQTLAAAQAGTGTVQISHLVIGDANGQPYLPQSRPNATALVNQRARVAVQSVAVVGDTVEVVATVDSTIGGFNLHEIGLTDADGQLLYLGNYHGGYKPKLTEGAGGDLELVLVLATNGLGPVVVELDPTVVTANRQWVLDRFVRIPTFDAHVAQNDLEHRNILSLITAANHARQIGDESIEDLLDQHVDASNPHPQYANKAQNTLEHNNLAQLITALNQRIAALEIREEIQVGEFIMTDDPRNPSEYKGYGAWRLVSGAFFYGESAGNAAGQYQLIGSGTAHNARSAFFWQRYDASSAPLQRTITISSNQTDLNLRDLFNETFGNPSANEHVLFVIPSNVLVIASSVANPAINVGSWPTNAQISIQNLGRIYGRGGDGGLGFASGSHPDEPGQDGGSAILTNHPITVSNSGVIAAGGGGGGGGGGDPSDTLTGGGGGGGAPYGQGAAFWGRPEGYTAYHIGADATLEEGGAGGSEAPEPNYSGAGGRGGDLGQAGQAGADGGSLSPGAGSAGGQAGIALVGNIALTGNAAIGR